MSVTMQTQNKSHMLTDQPSYGIGSNDVDQMTIHMTSSYEQKSAMNEELKMKAREGSPSLNQLFENTLIEKGESESLKNGSWISNNEITVQGVSKMALHSFILKAESLGKKIKYTRSLTVEITD